MRRIRVSLLAERDLDGIWRQIAADRSNIDIADRAVDSIVARFPLLARQPGAGKNREDIDPGVRSFPSGNYLIYYRETRSHLMISRILHCKRDHLSVWHKPTTS